MKASLKAGVALSDMENVAVYGMEDGIASENPITEDRQKQISWLY